MILRALLALIACLLALLPPGTLASIPRTAFVPPPAALFGVAFSNEQDCGPLTLHLDGLHNRAGPYGRVLVRQNPWTMFDPEGLSAWSNIWKGDFDSAETTWGGVVGQVVVGIIPIVGQVADARDTIANIGKVWNKPKSLGAWGGLGASIVGWVPLLGDGVKGLAKVGNKVAGEGAQAVAKHADEAASATTKTARGQVAENAKVVEPEAIPSGGKPDFVVTVDGTAIPVSQTQMREGFDKAGFPNAPATKTAESGTIHTVPGKDGPMDVRTMEGSSHHPKRAVFTDAGTNSPVTPSGAKFRSNETKQERRRDSHVEQKD